MNLTLFTAAGFASVLLFTLAGTGLKAQTSAAPTPSPDKATNSAGSLSPDDAKILQSISDSYYHPDDLDALECAVTVDWSALLASIKPEDAQTRLKVLHDIRIRSKASRGKLPEITFDWGSGTLTTKDQMENGLKQ